MGRRRIAASALALLAGCIVATAGHAAPARDGAATVAETAEAPALRDRLRERMAERRRGARQEPTDRLVIAGHKVDLWRPGSEQTSKAPLIQFSHGFHGCATQSTFLMAALARHGYVAAAPDHADASCAAGAATGLREPPEQKFRDAKAWSEATYRQRADDLKAVLDGLKADAHWSGLIDWSGLGLAGHSLGGHTVLGAAGAWPSWRLAGVKAVLALSPYCAPFADHGDLAHLGVPTMYQGGTRDVGITPFIKRPGGCYDKTAAPAYFVELSRAGHLAWTDLRPEHQDRIVAYALAFFDKYVAGMDGEGLGAKRDDVTELRSK